MTTDVKRSGDTKATITIEADEAVLKDIKRHVLGDFKPEVATPGFRKGKAPLSVVEKAVDSKLLEREFLDHALNELFNRALKEHNLRPVANPEVNVTKFVPFSELSFTVDVEVVPPIKLPDYQSMRKKPASAKTKPEEVAKVLDNLRISLAKKTKVERPAAKGDEVLIDFVGEDTSGEKIKGASGTDYPLKLGSDTFIKGFEDEVVGLKEGEDRVFELSFPKDYGVKALAGRKAKFTVVVKKVMEVTPPELNDELAAKAGPFKTLNELKADVEKQMLKQKQELAERELKNEILEEIATKAKLELPVSLVEEQVEAIKRELRSSLAYKGLTWEEHLAQEGVTEEELVDKQIGPDAKMRVRLGLVLSEIASREGIEVTPEELEIRLQLLKGQYEDEVMREQLATPAARREVASRLLSDKTIEHLYKTIVAH